jgi:3',5'-cyclic AMP phosphodiesterase CpdA
MLVGMIAALLATLLIATDPHVLSPTLHDDGEAFRRYTGTTSGRDLENNVALWDAFLEAALNQKPDAVLVTGDLTNQGGKESHRLVAAGLERLRAHGIRALVIPGNHDINNPWARGFRGAAQVPADAVSPDEFVQIYDRYGYGDALERDETSLSYLAQLNAHQWILMLDSAVYDINAAQGYPEVRGGFTDQSLAWIAACGQRARAAGMQLVAAMHHSVADHSAVIRDGYTVEEADQVARTLAEAGVRLVFTGHIHIQDIALRSTPAGPVYDVATNALSVFPNHYGRLQWSSSGALSYRSAKVVEPGSALDLHARSVLRSGSTRVFSEAEKQLMATLNENYFSGREDLNQRLKDTPEFRTLAQTEGFLGRHVQSLLADFDNLPDNELDLP